MRLISNADLPSASLPGLEHRTLAGNYVGLRHLSVWQQLIAPGGATPPHFHDCEEVVLVRGGSGVVEAADAVHRFESGTTIVIPPGEHHQIVNTGDVPLELVGIFAATPVGVFRPDGAALDLPWHS
jgi:mannose-6-phosphate isomerase-like protein (cupin superfamily)